LTTVTWVATLFLSPKSSQTQKTIKGQKELFDLIGYGWAMNDG